MTMKDLIVIVNEVFRRIQWVERMTKKMKKDEWSKKNLLLHKETQIPYDNGILNCNYVLTINLDCTLFLFYKQV